MISRSTICAALCLLSLFLNALGHPWPYKRRFTNASLPADESDEMPNLFIDWMRASIPHDTSKELAKVFVDGTIPPNVQSFDDLERYVVHYNLTDNTTKLPSVVWDDIPSTENISFAEEVAALFNHVKYPLDPACVNHKSQFWYRQLDGRCNWLKVGQSDMGSTGYPRSRDWGQTTYADGISKPREGPNPREVSNTFFKRKARIHYDHTPLMLGLVEFIMHDVTYSADSTTEYIDVPIPAGDPAYDPEGYGNATFRVWRTLPAAGSGTGPSNPRQHSNEATAWLDCSSLYGSTPEVVHALRSHADGKLKSQRGKDGFEYLPFNKDGLPVRTRPGVDIHDLFLGGDVRTNEDWIMLSVHTLFLREHNRLCDLVLGLHPDWDDERIYQTVRLVISAKLSLIGNAYQMAYWTDSMPWPRDDGFPLYRGIYNDSVLSINPIHLYPWPLVTRNDRPMITSAEMSIVYRFHEFIINQFPIKDEHNKTVEERNLFHTAFDSKTFFNIGADSILRGMLATDIPNFKSGVDEDFRSAGRYRGSPFDIVTWSVVHEREQGLPTFNEYFEGYANSSPRPALPVKIRKTFEDFSTDPKMVAHLKRLYKTPNDVDFVVGVQLEEEPFPGTTMPISALIPSLFSLFGVGNSDRFSTGFAVMRCILVDKPWNCHPSNALEELIWAPKPTELFPNARWFDPFWMTELDLQAHGANLLWRMITENSGAKYVLDNTLADWNLFTDEIIGETKVKSTIPWMTTVIALGVGLGIGIVIRSRLRTPKNIPPTNWGKFFIGCGEQLQKNPKGFVLQQAQRYGYSKTFGIRLLGSLVYYFCPTPADINVMMNDELRASSHALLQGSQFGAVVGRNNFAQELYASVIRRKLETERARVLPAMADVVSQTVNGWLDINLLRDSDDISKSITHLVAYVMSRVCLGRVGFDDPELIEAFIGLNTDSGIVFQMSNVLPSFMARIFSDIKVHKHYAIIKAKTLPVIHQRRKQQTSPSIDEDADDLLGFFIDVTDDDTRVAELVAAVMVGGLVDLVNTVTNSLYDIAAVPGLQTNIQSGAPPSDFVPDRTSASQWDKLRSAVLETLRLSACMFGPVRKIVVDNFKLGSDPRLVLPKGSGIAASQYLVHYDDKIYPNANEYVYNRFMGGNDTATGSAQYLTFGLPPHTCPGRFFAIQTASIALNAIYNKYDVQLCGPVPPGDRYTYSITVAPMPRKPLALKIIPKFPLRDTIWMI